MKRFLIFPLVLSIVGALFPALCMVQGMIPLLPIKLTLAASNSIEMGFFGRILFESWKTGALIGAGFGCALALWDLIRNKRDLAAVNRLSANSALCLFYAAIFIFLNAVLVSAVAIAYAQQKIWPPQLFIWWPFLGSWLMNFTAILWAGIRSITTDDILTPRVLRDKLRERSRLH